jgi:hypothetical protein
MLQTALNVLKWASIPVLLAGAIFSGLAATYEPIMDIAICLVAIGLVVWQARFKNYYCAAGFVTVVLVFSPLLLVDKMFFLMGFICIASFLTAAAAFRMEPAPAV